MSKQPTPTGINKTMNERINVPQDFSGTIAKLEIIKQHIQQSGNLDSEKFELEQIINEFKAQTITQDEAIARAEKIESRRNER